MVSSLLVYIRVVIGSKSVAINGGRRVAAGLSGGRDDFYGHTVTTFLVVTVWPSRLMTTL